MTNTLFFIVINVSITIFHYKCFDIKIFIPLTSDDIARNIAPESIGGKVPNKYCLVLNNELVRIRYLLVYSQEFGRLR